MEFTLTPIEVRVLGSLVEKEITTPEYYPLTLNALTNACNQKNNREPVTAFEEATAVRALDSLREKKLVFCVTGAGMRVPKYKHNLVEPLKLTPDELAVLCVLMLRGPQTLGELRGRSSTMQPIESLARVQEIIDALSVGDTRMPIVRKLPRHAGQKEIRYGHLLSGEPELAQADDSTRLERAVLQVITENDRISRLEEEVKSIREIVESLQKQLGEFKKQFE